jgi:hypothetical protein
MPEAVLIGSGAFAFGIVVGWLTYFILRRAKPTALSDLSTVVATLCGATVLVGRCSLTSCRSSAALR